MNAPTKAADEKEHGAMHANARQQLAQLRARNLELERELAERRKTEKHLEYVAYHDPLTGLPNRTLLLDRLGQAIAHARRNKGSVGVLFIDLDNFKAINDAVGHEVGDRLLKVVAQRLSEQVRENDTVARLGGDEFVAVLSNLVKSDDGSRVAEKILDAVGEPCCLDGYELSPTPSIGMALYPDHGENSTTLIRSADDAMYQAKASGRNRFFVFADEMAATERPHAVLESNRHGALERDKLARRGLPSSLRLSARASALTHHRSARFGIFNLSFNAARVTRKLALVFSVVFARRFRSRTILFRREKFCGASFLRIALPKPTGTQAVRSASADDDGQSR